MREIVTREAVKDLGDELIANERVAFDADPVQPHDYWLGRKTVIAHVVERPRDGMVMVKAGHHHLPILVAVGAPNAPRRFYFAGHMWVDEGARELLRERDERLRQLHHSYQGA